MAVINTAPLSTILEINIVNWSKVKFSDYVDTFSGSYSYSANLSIKLHLFLNSNCLRFRIHRQKSATAESIYCRLCLIDQFGKEIFTEGKILSFDVKCDDLPFTVWSLDGVKKFISVDDPLNIRCLFSILVESEIFYFSAREKASSLAENRSCLMDLSNNLSYLLEKRIRTDIVFNVGQEQIPAHRLILSARSSVFASMLQGIKENSCVFIHDIEPFIFSLILQFMYSGLLPEISSELMDKIYAAADKYAVYGLKEIIALKIIGVLSEDNACYYLRIADLHEDEMLKDGVIEFIMSHDILICDTWKEFCKSNQSVALEVYDKFTRKMLTSCSVVPKKIKLGA